MTESEFYQKEIKPMFIKKGLSFCRTNLYGMPDIYVARNNNVLWVELKCINKKSQVIRPQWRIGQLAWIKEQRLFGNNNVYLVLKYIDKTYFLTPKEFYLPKELLCRRQEFFKRFNKN